MATRQRKYLPLNMSVFPAAELCRAVKPRSQPSNGIDFIAHSCPLVRPNASLERFYLAMWAKDVRSVVVLSNVNDNKPAEKKKFERWWPGTGATKGKTVGAFKLTTVAKTSFFQGTQNLEMVIYTVKLSSGEKYKTIKVYHWTSWMDKTAPPVEDFKRVHQKFLADHLVACTVMVHCSAGVGRTGTFIAADTIARYSADQDTTTALTGVMTYMRSKRTQMIQTALQTKFIFEYFLGEEETTKQRTPAVKAQFKKLAEVEPKRVEPSHIRVGEIDRYPDIDSRPTVVSCRGVAEVLSSVCSSGESSDDISSLIKYMVADRSNLLIFVQFLEQYYPKSPSSIWEEVAKSPHPEFIEELTNYWVGTRIKSITPFEKEVGLLQIMKSLKPANFIDVSRAITSETEVEDVVNYLLRVDPLNHRRAELDPVNHREAETYGTEIVNAFNAISAKFPLLEYEWFHTILRTRSPYGKLQLVQVLYSDKLHVGLLEHLAEAEGWTVPAVIGLRILLEQIGLQVLHDTTEVTLHGLEEKGYLAHVVTYLENKPPKALVRPYQKDAPREFPLLHAMIQSECWKGLEQRRTQQSAAATPAATPKRKWWNLLSSAKAPEPRNPTPATPDRGNEMAPVFVQGIMVSRPVLSAQKIDSPAYKAMKLVMVYLYCNGQVRDETEAIEYASEHYGVETDDVGQLFVEMSSEIDKTFLKVMGEIERRPDTFQTLEQIHNQVREEFKMSLASWHYEDHNGPVYNDAVYRRA
jgi:protein tyrosine phosphatase